MKKKTRLKNGFLNAAIAAGVIVGCILLGGLGVVSMLERNFAPSERDGERFFQVLQEFDAFLENAQGIASAGQINRAFDNLEKKALSVESLLSVLKRRRILVQQELLAQKDAQFLTAYQKSARKAAARYPSSEPLAVVAAEALLVLPSAASEAEASAGVEHAEAGLLRFYASRLFETRYKPAALSVYVLLGDMHDPVRASQIPEKESLFPETIEQEQFALDDLILRILGGDIASAVARANELLKTSESPNTRNFIAQFFYDYDKPLQAARIFAESSGEESLIRQADALYLSNNTGSARSFWTMLSTSQNNAYKLKSLFNLAATETNPQKTAAFLDQLAVALQQHDDPSAPYATYGIIKYSRLLQPEAALFYLEPHQAADPLIELETLRREREIRTPEKIIAQAWILLNKRPSDERVYEWSGWLFNFLRRSGEVRWLIQNAAYNNITSSWLDLYKGVSLISSGDLDEAYEQLKGILHDTRSYDVPANIARIMEARHNDTAEALAYYEEAVLRGIDSPQNAARIHYRMSRCLYLLGRAEESRSALEKALALNPNYLAARAGLKRLDSL
ncbi:MAG: tetratricopeptide repeat protein [Treponema sp.]|jgi:tetratricopeptide (TPR) repeat protein|nr:tetratricopeptide repeat protein [Treponema sp.]